MQQTCVSRNNLFSLEKTCVPESRDSSLLANFTNCSRYGGYLESNPASSLHKMRSKKTTNLLKSFAIETGREWPLGGLMVRMCPSQYLKSSNVNSPFQLWYLENAVVKHFVHDDKNWHPFSVICSDFRLFGRVTFTVNVLLLSQTYCARVVYLKCYNLINSETKA